MAQPALVFVHSPLVGPLTWQAVAARYGSQRATVVDVTPALAGPPPYQPAIAAVVARAVAGLRRPVVLIGHSGAGPLLPGLAGAAGVPVAGLIYVDAGLPYPGRSWWETAPAELVEHLRGLASDGWLPPWHEWFAPEALAAVLPEERVRAAFTAELRPLPLAYFQEPMADATWHGPAGYLLLSEGYREDATRAAAAGMPVVEHLRHHLAMVTEPDPVADHLTGLVAEVAGVTARPPVR